MHRAVEAMRKCYSSLLSTLSALATNDATAKGLYKSIRTYKFLVFTHFLCDILGNLTYLSCFFQHNNIDFSQVQSAVRGTITNIQETYLEGKLSGEHLEHILEKLDLPLIFDDHQVVRKQSDDHQCYSSILQFAEAVIINLEQRFPDLPIWSSLKIFDPISYPNKTTSLRGFGKDDVERLMAHFGTPKLYKEECGMS